MSWNVEGRDDIVAWRNLLIFVHFITLFVLTFLETIIFLINFIRFFCIFFNNLLVFDLFVLRSFIYAMIPFLWSFFELLFKNFALAKLYFLLLLRFRAPLQARTVVLCAVILHINIRSNDRFVILTTITVFIHLVLVIPGGTQYLRLFFDELLLLFDLAEGLVGEPS